MRNKRSKHIKPNASLEATAMSGGKVFVVAVWIILLASIGLKVFKADVSGITYDESMTSMRYCDSVERAVTSFDRENESSTNNHLLNSIFIHYAKKYFGSYEHYIRIPSLIAGIVFSLSIFYIIRKSVGSKLICLAGVGSVLLVPMVFDYSLLARGYAFGLAGIYGGVAFVIYLLGHKIRYRYWFLPAVVMIAINYLCLGAMMSSLIILVCLNAVFVLFYCYKIVDAGGRWLRLIIYNSVTILAGTAGSVFYLYRHIYLDVINSRSLAKIAKRWHGWNSLGKYLDELILQNVLKSDTDIGTIVFYIMAIMVVCSILYYAYIAIRKFSREGFRQVMQSDSAASFMLAFSSISIAAIIVVCGIFKRSPGLLRSQVFLIPLVLIWAMVLLDQFADRIKVSKVKMTFIVLTSLLFATIAVGNIPSPYHVMSSSMSGPALRKLKGINAVHPWSITFSKDYRLCYMGFVYYRQFDYNFKMAPGGSSFKGPGVSDIFICGYSEAEKGSVCLDEKYFKELGCALLVHPGLAKSGAIDDSRLSVIE